MASFGDHINKFCTSRCKWQPCSIQNSTADNNSPLNMIEKSFQSLSPEEKQKIQQELYSGEEPIEESTELVNEKIQELHREMDKLNVNFKKAYTEALQQENEHAAAAVTAETRGLIEAQSNKEEEQHGEDNKDNKEDIDKDNEKKTGYKRYVTSRKFLLMFLRSERFNARFAARRLARYFKEKLELFGKEKLTLKIKQSDLDDKDLAVLRSGRIAIPGITDGCGRLVAICSRYWYRGDDGEKCINMKRAIFYLFQTWLEDHEESQKKGIVFISWYICPPCKTTANKRKSTSLIMELHSYKPAVDMAQRVMPMRPGAIHVVYNDLTDHMIINFFLLVLPTHTRRKHIFHFGPPAVGMLNMIPYGIDVDALPITEDGSFKIEDIIQYVNVLQRKDEG